MSFNDIICSTAPKEDEKFPLNSVFGSSSFNVFHSPQLGHLPYHFGDSKPHSLQTYVDLTFAIIVPL